MLRLYILLITLFVSFSAFSGTEQHNLSLPLANAITMSDSDQMNILDNSVADEQLSETDNSPLPPVSENHSKSIDFIQPIHFNQLNNKQQPAPEYVLLYELLIEKTNEFANLESVLSTPPVAWFMSYANSDSRLSGWKDSNSQYASKVTYHLS